MRVAGVLEGYHSTNSFVPTITNLRLGGGTQTRTVPERVQPDAFDSGGDGEWKNSCVSRCSEHRNLTAGGLRVHSNPRGRQLTILRDSTTASKLLTLDSESFSSLISAIKVIVFRRSGKEAPQGQNSEAPRNIPHASSNDNRQRVTNKRSAQGKYALRYARKCVKSPSDLLLREGYLT